MDNCTTYEELTSGNNLQVEENLEEIINTIYLKHHSQIKKQIPPNRKKGYKKVSNENLGQRCSICLDLFKLCEFKRELSCKHVFHKKCIDKKNNKGYNIIQNCPLCRKEIKQD